MSERFKSGNTVKPVCDKTSSISEMTRESESALAKTILHSKLLALLVIVYGMLVGIFFYIVSP